MDECWVKRKASFRIQIPELESMDSLCSSTRLAIRAGQLMLATQRQARGKLAEMSVARKTLLRYTMRRDGREKLTYSVRPSVTSHSPILSVATQNTQIAGWFIKENPLKMDDL